MDWFSHSAGPDTADPTKQWLDAMAALGPDAPEIIEQGIKQAVTDQVGCGIDIPTDGEIIRENYIHYHCRHLHGFDFVNLTEKEVRGGAYSAKLPSIVGPVSGETTVHRKGLENGSGIHRQATENYLARADDHWRHQFGSLLQ